MGTKAKHHIAPTVRAAFLRGLELVEREGMTFSEMMAAAIKEQGILTVLDKVGKYIERTSQVDLNVRDDTLLAVLTGISQGHDTPVEGEPDSIRH